MAISMEYFATGIRTIQKETTYLLAGLETSLKDEAVIIIKNLDISIPERIRAIIGKDIIRYQLLIYNFTTGYKLIGRKIKKCLEQQIYQHWISGKVPVLPSSPVLSMVRFPHPSPA